MQIWLPIIINLILLGIVVSAAFKGSKKGFGIMLAKFLVLVPLLIGSYFLTPIIVGALPTLTSEFSTQILSGASILTLTLISYSLASFVVWLVRYGTLKAHQGPAIKLEGIDKQATRELRRQQREIQEANREPLSRASRVFGVLISMLIATIVLGIIMVGINGILEGVIATKPELSWLSCGYDYTLYGLLDNHTAVGEFILHI